MNIYDTLGRVLLGMTLGFVMGIVIYQSAGIDVGVEDKRSLMAQNTPYCGFNDQGVCGGDSCASGYVCGVSGTDCICLPNPPIDYCGFNDQGVCGGDSCASGYVCGVSGSECYCLRTSSTSSSSFSSSSSSSTAQCCNLATNTCQAI